jgi:hypothetical protein
MNRTTYLAIVASTALTAAAWAADKAEPTAGTRVSGGAVGQGFYTRAFAAAPVEREEATFLGVETMPVNSTLTAQLNLPRDVGLVVRLVVLDSPAADVLRVDDVLLKLDDQHLIESRQFAVLVRNKKEGDEVALTYLRGGKQAVAKVKLVKREVPKLNAFFEERLPMGAVSVVQQIPGGMKWDAARPEENRAQVDRLLSLMQPTPGSDPVRMRIEPAGRFGFRAMGIDTTNSNLAYSDDQGALEIATKDGKKSLVAKDPKGEEVFSGPISTPEERKALPPAVRERLEKVEGMHDITFRTEGNFQAPEIKVMPPTARGIVMPIPATAAPARSPLF